MSDEQSPTFGLQAAGSTPANETRQVTELHIDDPAAHPQTGESQGDVEERLLAGTYKTHEELEKGYLEQQRMHSKSTSDMDMQQFLDHLGLDAADMGTNWRADGKLSDAQYEQFRQAGWSKSIVDSVMRANESAAHIGQFEQRELQARGHELAGGKEEFDGLINWAQSAYPDAQKEQLNIKLGDSTEFESAIKAMLYDYKQQSGTDVRHHMVQGETMPNVSSGFTSSDEAVSALREARKQGRVDAALQRRLANTPDHILQGLDQ